MGYCPARDICTDSHANVPKKPMPACSYCIKKIQAYVGNMQYIRTTPKNKNMQKDLEAMVADGVIDQQTARQIATWYAGRRQGSPSSLMIIFGVLASLLVATGILLVIAHNWDDFPRWVKTGFAFLPLALGQAGAIMCLLGKWPAPWQREATGAWLALSIGICIALVSQIYHLPGKLDTFLLTWLVLGLPILYVLRSGTVSVLYTAGAAWYVVEAGYGWQNRAQELPGWPFWLLLLLMLPFYLQQIRQQPKGWFTALLHIVVPIALLLGLGIFFQKNGYAYTWPAYVALLTLFILASYLLRTRYGPAARSGYTLMGWVGCIGLLTAATFREFWKEIAAEQGAGLDDGGYWAVVACIALVAAAIVLWYLHHWRHRPIRQWHPLSVLSILFPLLWLLALSIPAAAAIWGNLVMLGLAVWLMLIGQRQGTFLYLNAGLALIAILAVSRFFDTDLSFILRGLIFIAVGTGFGVANYQLIKKKQQHG